MFSSENELEQMSKVFGYDVVSFPVVLSKSLYRLLQMKAVPNGGCGAVPYYQ